jgi:hypothetical protein
MDRRKNYSHDQEKYLKGYENHNHLNARELQAGNNLRHLKWYDNGAQGHIFFNRNN